MGQDLRMWGACLWNHHLTMGSLLQLGLLNRRHGLTGGHSIQWDILQPQIEGDPAIVTTRTNLEAVFLSKIRQAQEGKYCMSSLTCIKVRITEAESRPMVTQGGRWGKWEDISQKVQSLGT